jgi:hypothetical protein
MLLADVLQELIVAENELLDVANGKRWAETRRDLRAGMDPGVIAYRAVEDLNRGIRRSLFSAQKKRAPLRSLIQEGDLSKENERAAIDRFPDRTLARIVVRAFHKLPGCKNLRTLIDTVTPLVIDQVRDAIMRHAGESVRYRDFGERQALALALSSALGRFRRDLHSLIGASIAGTPVKLMLRPRTTEASRKVRIRTVLEQSLVPAPAIAKYAQQRH